VAGYNAVIHLVHIRDTNIFNPMSRKKKMFCEIREVNLYKTAVGRCMFGTP